MTGHTSYPPQLDPSGLAHPGDRGWKGAKEGDRLLGVGNSTWPGCWPWL